jgi:hypothetical protein
MIIENIKNTLAAPKMKPNSLSKIPNPLKLDILLIAIPIRYAIAQNPTIETINPNNNLVDSLSIGIRLLISSPTGFEILEATNTPPTIPTNPNTSLINPRIRPLSPRMVIRVRTIISNKFKSKKNLCMLIRGYYIFF